MIVVVVGETINFSGWEWVLRAEGVVTKLDIGIIELLWSLSLEFVFLGQKSCLAPFWMVLQNFGISIESKIGSSLGVDLWSLLLFLSLGGEEMGKFELRVSSDESNTDVDVLMDTKVNIWSLLLALA